MVPLDAPQFRESGRVDNLEHSSLPVPPPDAVLVLAVVEQLEQELQEETLSPIRLFLTEFNSRLDVEGDVVITRDADLVVFIIGLPRRVPI